MSWRDVLDWFKPTFIAEREQALGEVLGENDQQRKDVRRQTKHCRRMEADLEGRRAREEALVQQVRHLCEQARRCKCRS